MNLESGSSCRLLRGGGPRVSGEEVLGLAGDWGWEAVPIWILALPPSLLQASGQ